ncbi:MarR family transcriptional regulator [Arthrobacter sp. AL08]|uniref:MarR family winged helix-turn-helix transcriptional regulator n=1 Tax=unclassified Arthrobacter TaxID=235627 RepID=UPI001D000305|nr:MULTISPECIES: MarR family transcriptional regulator [unclassified Arthrobacter]MCB5282347.1 Multiple antibiotic resistance protein MarR [Arthrobacter sp. ES1]MDI3242427.1 MarR family transcriptional regulator [Arthrobacter sp. AL05]MDI3278437.1 MarR family transcriptional regulator [Arthrobacter sp. AL08]WGZ78211.1 MarR family transcriptional regulator [Arthrobacter sp. EM1]
MGRETPRTTYALAGFPYAAVRFVRALERNREKIATDHGLSPSELRALFWIAEQASVTPKQLAEHMELTTGAITAISTRLVNLGWLERLAHPNDRRSLCLELTDSGHSVVADIHAQFNTMIASSTTGLSDKELAAFETALLTVADEVSRRTGM